MFGLHKVSMIAKEDALPGRKTAMPVPEKHFVSGVRLSPPFPEGTELALFGMGCFWGEERVFWQVPGVYSTSVGYAGVAGASRPRGERQGCSRSLQSFPAGGE